MELYLVIFWLIGFCIGLFLLYLIIQTAIVNGIRDSGILDRTENSLPEQNPAYYKSNSAQSLLKSRYERGEISFEEYIQEWNKLKS